MKHGIPKGDKKRKKEVIGQIADLEMQLKEKQEKELRDLKSPDKEVIEKIGGLSLANESNEAADGEPVFEYSEVKVSKAQKRRDRKAKQERENRLLIDQQFKADSRTSQRTLEEQRLRTILVEQGFRLHDIPSDGDCMYKAIEHQLSLQGIEIQVSDLRRRCANILRVMKEEYLPFLLGEDEGLLDDSKYQAYCDKIENTKAWGGNVELQALSYDLKLPIKVLQANGPSIDLGDQFKYKQPLILR